MFSHCVISVLRNVVAFFFFFFCFCVCVCVCVFYSNSTAIVVLHQFMSDPPGRVAQSVGHLTRKSDVLGSTPGQATYFRFSFR